MLPEISLYYALSLIVLSRKGLIFFPDFCQLCLEKFRETEEEEEEFYKLAFKVWFQTLTDFHNFICWCLQLFCGTDPFPTDFRAKKYKLNKHFITKQDFQHIMRSLPVPVSELDIEEMFNFSDKNRDGKLSYKEFEVIRHSKMLKT